MHEKFFLLRRHQWRHRITFKSPSIFLYKWKINTFLDNLIKNRDINIKLGVHVYYEIVNIMYYFFFIIQITWYQINNLFLNG